MLSEELPENLFVQMNAQEKKQYNIQREKFKGKQETLKKSQNDPKNTKFTLETAKVLAEGTYWDDEDDDDENFVDKAFEKATNDKVNKAVYLNRENLENELKLE